MTLTHIQGWWRKPSKDFEKRNVWLEMPWFDTVEQQSHASHLSVSIHTVSSSRSEHSTPLHTSRTICFLFSYACGPVLVRHRFHWIKVTPMPLVNGAARRNTWLTIFIIDSTKEDISNIKPHSFPLVVDFDRQIFLQGRKPEYRRRWTVQLQDILDHARGEYQPWHWCATLPCWKFISNSSILSPSQGVGNEHGQFSSLVGIYLVVPTMLECTAMLPIHSAWPYVHPMM